MSTSVQGLGPGESGTTRTFCVKDLVSVSCATSTLRRGWVVHPWVVVDGDHPVFYREGDRFGFYGTSLSLRPKSYLFKVGTESCRWKGEGGGSFVTDPVWSFGDQFR